MRAHPLAGLRWWVVWHTALVAVLVALAGLTGLHYMP